MLEDCRAVAGEMLVESDMRPDGDWTDCRRFPVGVFCVTAIARIVRRRRSSRCVDCLRQWRERHVHRTDPAKIFGSDHHV